MKKPSLICLNLIVLILTLFALNACGSKNEAIVQQDIPMQKTVAKEETEVILRIAGNWTDCRAVEWAATEFKKEYPNCTVVYEYLQGEYNEALKKRLQSEGDNRVDLFMHSSNLQAGHALDGCGLDLMSLKELDLSGTFASLVQNSMYIERDGSAPTKLYSIPFGAQMRGLYVNVSLLNQVGIAEVPKNQEELLAACAVLKDAGYVPFHGAPSLFAQQLLYPWICNQIANAENYEEAYNLVNARDPKATELFREIYEFLYTLVENDYYDSYYSQGTLNLCTGSSTGNYAYSLLNITEVLDTKGNLTGEYKKVDDGCGQVAFLPYALSMLPSLEEKKEDYHSDIEYVFIPAPVGKDGGFVYLSPSDVIIANKDTQKKEWVIKFLNFLFTPENNEQFAERYSIMPNTKEAFGYVSSLYDVPTNHISELGQATFDWPFYRTMTRTNSEDGDIRALPAISEANDPNNLNPDTNEMYPFEHFWEQFVTEFTTLG